MLRRRTASLDPSLSKASTVRHILNQSSVSDLTFGFNEGQLVRTISSSMLSGWTSSSRMSVVTVEVCRGDGELLAFGRPPQTLPIERLLLPKHRRASAGNGGLWLVGW
ncbi:hypothetical protein Moror_5318 [Moniliophthora roreri MCA 2997]|uniref:Uncharacterized protein n=1 Tax=Moniliophthora roreri (strain MCA 2997) TaxID=1381753 RepID=V2X9D0_MONRO|nr:hypothetical protein Moror_5318 [Moniliophthora roreri MCA 2997]KAI3595073.1 hypothetical protein WG66_001105 [Moniliophthora roreri]